MDLKKLSYGLTSDFDVPCPPNLSYLPHQIPCIEFLANVKHALIADPPGVGKTIEVLGYLNLKQGRFKNAVIICPASVVQNWKLEAEKWLIDKSLRVVVIETIGGKIKYNPDSRHVYICSYNIASKPRIYSFFKLVLKAEVLIYDESHYLKSPQAIRTMLLFSKNGISSLAKKIIAMTGTPIDNRPIELYTTINALCPKAINSMSLHKFGLKYCGGYFNAVMGQWDYRGATNTKELGEKLRSTFMIRRSKEAVLPNLPEKTTGLVMFTNKSLAKKFKPYEKNVLEDIPLDVDNMGELATLRKELGDAKLKFALNYVQDLIVGGREKIIIFAHHKKVIEGLEKGLASYGVVCIKGGTNSKNRQSAIDDFQNKKEIVIFLGSLTAANTGITLTAADYVMFVEFSWVPGHNEQGGDRAHRIGQTKGVLIEYLVLQGSLDERILLKNINKSKVIKEIMQ